MIEKEEGRREGDCVCKCRGGGRKEGRRTLRKGSWDVYKERREVMGHVDIF